MASGSEHLSPGLADYLAGHSTPPDALLRDLTAETAERFPDHLRMQIGHQQGTFLTMLAGLMEARHAVEVGTFTGYSSICLARGMATDGKLICCDISEEWTRIGRKAWQRAGVADRIELRLGPGLDTLRDLPRQPHLDFVFIDADKGGYVSYWNELVPRVLPGGLLLADNVLWSGRIVDARTDDQNGTALRAFNDRVAADERVEVVVLPAFDGLTLARKR